MKVLVTGSHGQLGKALQQAAAQYPQLSLLYTDIDELDITRRDDITRFVALHQPAFIINAAAYTAVDKAEDEPAQAERLNAVAAGNLVAAAFTANACLLHISTDYVFDGEKSTPYLETDQPNPLSVYGETKARGEQAVLSYKRGMVVRTAWLYATEGHNFVNTMLRLGSEGKTLRVVNDQYGSPTYAADLADTLLQIALQVANDHKQFINGIYHYTNSGVCTWYEFAQQIMQLSGLSPCLLPCATTDYPTKAHRPKYSVLNTQKIQQTYGIQIPTWQDGLKRCFLNKE